MDEKIQYTIGALLILILTSGIVYVTFNNVKLRVDNDKSTFYVKDTYWRVAGREYNSIFDGTSKMNRRLDSISVTEEHTDKWLKIYRTTTYIRGPVIKDTYYFEGDIDDVELFPIYHEIEIFNGSGYFYRYEVRDLEYNGEREKIYSNEMNFGKNMKVAWQDNYRWAWVYADGILKVQYDIPTDYEKFRVKLFDPPANKWLATYEWNGTENVVNKTIIGYNVTEHNKTVERVNVTTWNVTDCSECIAPDVCDTNLSQSYCTRTVEWNETIYWNTSTPIYNYTYDVLPCDRKGIMFHIEPPKKDIYINCLGYSCSMNGDIFTIKGPEERGASCLDNHLDECNNLGVPCEQFDISEPGIGKFFDLKEKVEDVDGVGVSLE